MPVVSFAVLGPLEARNEHGPINLKGLRHRAVLARLLIARSRVVPVGRLIDDLWERPPEGALGTVQTFVSALRKTLEPDRAPRMPARLLISAPPGYAVRAEPESVDAWRFEAAVASSAELLAAGRPGPAHMLLDDALELWRGPAYAEFVDHDWARAEADRLEALRRLAVARRAEAALALGRAAETVPELEAQVAGHPLDEDGWRLLASALYLAGRQGDALAALRRAREVLRTELGVDPGPTLRQLEADILAQAAHLTADRTAPPQATPQLPASPSNPASLSNPASPSSASSPSWKLPPNFVTEEPFVGRTEELAELEAAAAAASTGRPRLALLSGTAGAGKTSLAKALTANLATVGWRTAWGTSPELPGAPAVWPWTQLRESLGLPPDGTSTRPEGTSSRDDGTSTQDDDPVAGRFRRHRAITAGLATISAGGPVLLVFDDLHWADEETLALLTALVSDPDTGPVLVVGTYRSTEISAALTEALGRAARTEPTRIYLSGLTEPQVQELTRALSRRELGPDDVRMIHTRSAGNPFYVRELARLWESDPAAALHTVPAGVRDVIRHRLSGLTETARNHLRQAAVIGQEVDLDLLIPLTGDDEEQVLDSVEAAVVAGFLVEANDGAEQLRFAHALVHETLYAELTLVHRVRRHAALAEIIETVRPDDVEAIAHHLLRAGSRADATRTAYYLRLAAERTEGPGRFAPHEAARLWRETVAALDRSGDDDPRARLSAMMGLVRALAVTGELSQARQYRAEAVATAEGLGDPLLTASVIGAFDVPAIWTANDDEALSARLVAAAERTLIALPADRHSERARLLITIAMERRADAQERGHQAACEAEAIARRTNDHTLLAFALNGRFMQTFHRAGLAPERARIGEELRELTTRSGGLVTFEVLAHLVLIQARIAMADLEAADRHAAAVDRLAERYELPLVAVFTDWYAALRLVVTGHPDEARNAYRKAAIRLVGSGMPGLEEGILPLALLCAQAPELPSSDLHDCDWGPYEPWARPLILFAKGDREQALAATRRIPASPHDLLLEARTCLHALAAIQADDRPTMDRLYADLLPAADELAGAGSGLLTLGPTAHYLALLATALGHPAQAEIHHTRARALSSKLRPPAPEYESRSAAVMPLIAP